METLETAPIPITSDERTMATLAHVLQLVGSWIAPLIILLVKRDSKFVSFHALQALLLQIVHLAIWIVIMVAWFAMIFGTVILHDSSGNKPPVGLFILFPILWLAMMGMWLVTLIIAVLYGIRAGQGEWAEYPVIGPLARRFLKLGPDGAALSAGQ